MRKSKNNRSFVIVFRIFLLIMLALTASTVIGLKKSNSLVTSCFQIPCEVLKPIRIVHLSDLHNKEFGAGNAELIALVAEQKPDLIFMSGDMLNQDDLNTEIVSDLIKTLASIAPVYFGYGNHEYTWEKNFNKNLREIITDAGATVVNNNYVDIEVNGQALRIGGYMGYYRQPGMFWESQEQYDFEIAFADDFENTARIKVLINHIPTPWVDWGYNNLYPVNLVLSGHYHGGMIYFPLLERGLYAPYVGWFPENVRGVFEGEKATCVLSAGLGSEYQIPRIHNNPEIVVVDLIPERQD